MKKILFAALAALAITSCSQNEEIEAPTQKTEINFRSVVGKSSRAAEATTENLESQGFILYAYNTKTITMDKVTAGSLTTTFINGKKATCTNSNWSVADGPYYWPIAENLQFFADYILLSASMGCIFAALRAGYIPKNTPIAVENPTAITIVENFISIGIFI